VRGARSLTTWWAIASTVFGVSTRTGARVGAGAGARSRRLGLFGLRAILLPVVKRTTVVAWILLAGLVVGGLARAGGARQQF
jgi:hypothetical protein